MYIPIYIMSNAYDTNTEVYQTGALYIIDPS